MQENLSNIFGYIAIFFLVLLILGLFNPRAALFWSSKPATRKRSATINGLAMAIFLLACGSLAPQSAKEATTKKDPNTSSQPAAASKPTPAYTFELAETKRSYDYVRFNLVMPDLYPREALIEKTRQLRKENSEGKLICYFYYKKYSEPTSPVAGTGYIPNCSNCTYKDKDGNLVDFPFYHLEKPLADSLLALTFDTAGYKLEARFFSMGSKVITLIMSSKGNKALQVFLSTEGHSASPMIRKSVVGQDRFVDPDDSSGYYLIDRRTGFVDFYGEKGLDMQMVLEQ